MNTVDNAESTDLCMLTMTAAVSFCLLHQYERHNVVQTLTKRECIVHPPSCYHITDTLIKLKIRLG